MTGLLTRTRRAQGISRETAAATKAFLGRHTNFRDVDLSRLSRDEQHELYALIQKTAEPSGATDLSQLGRRFEQLAEQAAGQPGAFGRERDAATLRDRAAAIARRAAKATRPKPGGEAALWEQVGEHLARREAVLHSEHLLVLSLVLAQLAHGKTVAPESRIEDGALIVHDRFGLIGEDRDEYSLIAGRWQSAALHLQANQYVSIERRGVEWVIRPGRRVARALWGQS